MNLQIRAVKLQKLIAEIEKYRASTILSILEIGKRWQQIRDEKLWAYTPEIKSFRYYIEKETTYSHGTVYNYIAISEYYGDNQRVLELSEPTRLIKALPIIHKKIEMLKDEKEIQEVKDHWLYCAIAQNKNDYEEEIRLATGQISQEDCLHDNIKTIKVCKTCNKKLGVS